MTYQKVEEEIAGRPLILETGRWAKQASGSVLATYGGTTVLVAAQNAKAREGLGFFPLTVDYREKTYAAGKFPGGFFKREARPTTKEVLTCRLIDRSIRPLFPDGYLQEIQVMATVLVYDQEVDPDIVAMIGAFAALSVSEIPFTTHLAACRIGYMDGEIVINPGASDLGQSRLNLTMAATKDSVAMVEAGAKEVSEDAILDALEAGQKVCGRICKMIEQLAKKAGRKKVEFEAPEVRSDVDKELGKKFLAKVKSAINKKGSKKDRGEAYSEVADEAVEHFTAKFTKKKLDADEIETGLAYVTKKLSQLKDECQREGILAGKRVDGRGSEDIREITVETGILPRVHGSAVFTRGETQALVVTTLGTVDDEQIIDGLEDEYRKKFILHYNFPPYSVGECRMIRGVGRREIGHGALAERSVTPVLPSPEEFPYTIRVVSEILESNGSSSMASVCGCCSALMDAGVPIRQPVAGIAMGLVKEGRKTAILSDILGSEDHCGDMDFKVAGTQFGITALQMDIKCTGLTRSIMKSALDQAKKGRIHILKEMLSALKRPRKDLSRYAPRLSRIEVNPEKIGIIIGPGGKNIRALQEETKTKINVDDDGTVIVSGLDAEKVEIAVDRIQGMTAEVEIGQTYKGRVVAIKEFGAFVEVLPGQEGLLHVSEITDSFIRSVTDVLNIGDEIEVRVVHVDDFGKIKLSRKILLDAGGGEDREELVGAGADSGPRDSSRSDRSGGRRDTGRRGQRRSPAGGSARRSGPRTSGSRPRRRNGN
ncbi:MAG: polyribonucleotide nucleotidyltransferase [Planctomycetota bacterium]